jgi:hypothetical protein
VNLLALIITAITAHLGKLVKQYDTSRPVTFASAFPEIASRIGLSEVLDVIGYNYKKHLYDKDHKRFPKKPILGRGALLRSMEGSDKSGFHSGCSFCGQALITWVRHAAMPFARLHLSGES